MSAPRLRNSTTHDDAALEAALERSLARLVDGERVGSLIAAREPEHAFELRPLLDTAITLGALYRDAEPRPEARARLMALVRNTPQAAPSRGLRERLAEFARRARVFVAPASSGVARRGLASLALVGALMLAIAVTGELMPVERASAATLTVVAGTVERLGGASAGAVLDGAVVFEGDTLRLGPDAVAILTFRDGSTVQLSGGAEATVSRARFEASPQIRVEQRAGQVIADLIPAAGASLTLGAPDALIEVHAGGFAADVSAEGTRIQAFEHAVAVHASDGAQVVEPGASRLIEREHEGRSGAVDDPSRRSVAPEPTSRAGGPTPSATVVLTATAPPTAPASGGGRGPSESGRGGSSGGADPDRESTVTSGKPAGTPTPVGPRGGKSGPSSDRTDGKQRN